MALKASWAGGNQALHGGIWFCSMESWSHRKYYQSKKVTWSEPYFRKITQQRKHWHCTH